MSNKRIDRRRDIKERLSIEETNNHLKLKCGNHCPLIDLVDRAFKVMAKVRKGVYRNVQEGLLPAEIALPTNYEHQENIRTIHQQIFYSRFQSIGLSCNIPTSDVLGYYGLHITDKP